ncbi:hypothetical protein CMO90_04160 [Candidatus Woesearchaeota archaeon]|nr:hypothetical protein [Candidatus Woesearchaeota archaeon]
MLPEKNSKNTLNKKIYIDSKVYKKDKMGLFSTKKPEKTGIPTSQVASMREQGLDNNRIIQTLQRDGYSSASIFEAMNQADSTPAVNNVSSAEIQQEQKLEESQSPKQLQPETQDYSRTSFKQPQEAPSAVPEYQQSPNVEELVESVIEEKWNDLVSDINAIIDWKNKIDAKISSIEQDLKGLKDDFDKLQEGVLGKIGEYDKNILLVGAEVKAMEKVFSKVLPVFTDNVSELSRVADTFKKNSKK